MSKEACVRRCLASEFAPMILIGVLVAAAPAMAGSVESLMARSRAAELKGRFDQAVGLMQAAVVAAPARVASYVALAGLYARRSEPNFARKYYDEALDIDPTFAPALLGAGRNDLTLGDRAAASERLIRLEKSCGADCAETLSLRAAIATFDKAGPDATSASLDKQ